MVKADLISLRVDPDSKCSGGGHTRALITPVPLAAKAPLLRKSSWIWAEDLKNGKRVDCEVLVDKVGRIEILTSTRNIYVGDVQEIYLQGFDAIGNVFSSLAGLPFAWSNTMDHLARRVSFAEAGLKVGPWYLAREQHQLDTDLLPVRGIQPGVAQITARLTDPGHAASATVSISVTEALCLKPEEVWMAPQSELHLLVRTKPPFRDTKQEGGTYAEEKNPVSCPTVGEVSEEEGSEECLPVFTQVVGMPHPQYLWERTALPGAPNPNPKNPKGAPSPVKEDGVIRLDKRTGEVQALVLGNAAFRVFDVDTPEYGMAALVHVVKPARLELRVRQQRPAECLQQAAWSLTHKLSYAIEFWVLDAQGHKMVISKNMRFDVRASKSDAVLPTNPPHANAHGRTDKANPAPEHAFEFSVNAREFHVHAANLGLIEVFARVDAVGSYQLEKALLASITLNVTSPIEAVPEQVVLAWWGMPSPTPNITHSTQIHAHGGSGQLEWNSTEVTVAPVSGSGVVWGRSLGEATVRVFDRCNPANHRNVLVYVSEPAPPKFLPGPVEAQVGSVLALAVGVQDKAGRRFTECSDLRLDTWVSSASAQAAVFTLHSPPESVKCEARCRWGHVAGSGGGFSCWELKVLALQAGFTTAHAKIDFKHLNRNPPHLKTSDCARVISGFLPLEVTPKVMHLAIGTRVNVTWAHGPLAWGASGFSSASALADANSKLYAYRPANSMLASAAVPLRRKSWGELVGAELEFQAQGSVKVYEPQDLAQVNEEGATVTVHPAAGSQSGPNSHAFYSYHISCLDVAYEHAMTLRVRVGNTPVSPPPPSPASSPPPPFDSDNPVPVVAEVLIKLLCYPQLALVPRRMVLSVNTQRPVLVLTARDGVENLQTPEAVRAAGLVEHTHPLARNVTFAMEDPSIATVDHRGLITAVKLGVTTLTAQVEHPVVGALVAEGLWEKVEVVVHFLGFFIRTPTQQLLPSHAAFLHLEGVEGEVPGDVAFKAVECEWGTSNSGLQLRPVLSSMEERRPYVVEGPSVGVIARHAGTYRLTARIRVHLPPPSTNVSDFMHWVEIVVGETLVLLSPARVVVPFGVRMPLLTSLDHSQLVYTLFPREPTHAVLPDSPSFASVDSNGILETRTLPRHYTDAPVGEVVVVISTHGIQRESPLSSDPTGKGLGSRAGAPRSLLPLGSQTRQSVAVNVLLRAPQQLALRPRSFPTGPLCVGEEVVVEVVLLDRLGHVFDTLEGWAPGDTALRIHSTHPSVVSVRKKSLEEEDASGRGKPATRGILSLFQIQAAGLGEGRVLEAAVIRITLVNQSSIPSLFFPVHVADAAHCHEPLESVVTVSFLASMDLGELSDEAGFHAAGELTRRRADFVAQLVADLATALDLNAASIWVRRVGPRTGAVEVDFLPAHATHRFHPDQWHTAYQADPSQPPFDCSYGPHARTPVRGEDAGQTATATATATAKEDRRKWKLPVEAAQELMSQVANPSSVLRTTVSGKHLAPMGPAFKSYSQHWRRGSGGSGGSGGAEEECEAPLSSVWTDTPLEEVQVQPVRYIEAPPIDSKVTKYESGRSLERTLRLFMATQLGLLFLGLLYVWVRRAGGGPSTGFAAPEPYAQDAQFPYAPSAPPSAIKAPPPRQTSFNFFTPLSTFTPRPHRYPAPTPVAVSKSTDASGRRVRGLFDEVDEGDEHKHE